MPPCTSACQHRTAWWQSATQPWTLAVSGPVCRHELQHCTLEWRRRTPVLAVLAHGIGCDGKRCAVTAAACAADNCICYSRQARAAPRSSLQPRWSSRLARALTTAGVAAAGAGPRGRNKARNQAARTEPPRRNATRSALHGTRHRHPSLRRRRRRPALQTGAGRVVLAAAAARGGRAPAVRQRHAVDAARRAASV